MSTNKIPGNVFPSGLQVFNGISTDSLVVNGVNITSGSGVSTSTDINNNSVSIVPTTSVTFQLKTKNDNQDTTLNSHDTTLTSHTTSITALNAAMDILYGGVAGGWIGQAASAWYSGSQYVAKSGSTMTGDLALGTNNITSVKDIKLSNAIILTNQANVYCGNVITGIGGFHIGDGSKLTNVDHTNYSNFGTNSGSAVSVGKAGQNLTLNGSVQDVSFGATNSITSVKDIKYANALIGTNTANIYCGNVICVANAKFYGDGSGLTGVVASSTDTTSALNICTVPTTGALKIGTALNSTGSIQIGNTSLATAPSVTITAGPTGGLGLASGTGGTLINSQGTIAIGQTFQCPINIGYNTGGTPATNPLTLYASSLNASLNHSISSTATHTSMTKGLIQTMIIPLSGEQGPISLTSGGGVLPTVLLRAPFAMNIYGARLSCLQASTSGVITVDVQNFAQNTSIGPSTVNSTTGTSIFGAAKLNIDQPKYSSYGSTAVLNNGQLASTPYTVADDSLLAVFVTSIGTSVLGLKLTIYWTY